MGQWWAAVFVDELIKPLYISRNYQSMADFAC
jgi:hypothetical protein